jgi:hypothetical protein
MPRLKKDTPEPQTEQQEMSLEKPDISDVSWTDYVLSQLSDDEKIKGNPTTDGLRRIFESVLNCSIISILTDVVQSPSPDNEKRATVVYRLDYILNDSSIDKDIRHRSVSGAADVYWGNCDKVYRNHPVAVAETRAEGRALRRALRLRKVVAAEEIVDTVEDHPDSGSVNKITNNQINFIDVIGQRLNINISKLLESSGLDSKNIYSISHQDAVSVIRNLSKYQQDTSSISDNLIGYTQEWK